MVFSNNLLMGAAGQASGYDIDQSIRFNDNDSAHLSRTLGTASNRKIWTYSLWMKRATLGTRQMFFTVAAGGGAQGIIEFDQGDGGDGGMDKLVVNNETSGTTALNWELEIAFRDPAAWYNFVFVYDSTQSTTNDRFKCYVNGTLQTAWDRNSTPGQNEEQAFNNALDHRIGEGHTAANYFDGYMAEIHFIDGTAKAASDFGETNSDTGEWVPTTYGGSYGNNGFYLKGQDSSALGDDTSGNGNDFASSGLAAADQVEDSPTDNFCTYNPLRIRGTNTLSDGNLQAAAGSAGAYVTSTFGVSSGKWYWEYSFTGTFNFPIVGVMDATLYEDAYPSQLDRAVLYYSSNGNKYIDSTSSSYGASYAVDDIVGVGLNLDDNEITFYKNNSTQGTFSITNREYTPLAGEEGSTNGGIIANFGQLGFEYTPPTGFKALTTTNLPDPAVPDPSAHFQSTVYTGNGSTQSISQSGENSTFQPDFVWIKNRDSAGNEHALYDVLRGATKEMNSSTTSAEHTQSTGLTAFESDGFAVGSRGEVNTSGDSTVAWQWKANGAGSSNEDGSINTTATSANTTSGFSISTFTGNGTSGATFGHGLGVAPKMVIVKERDPGGNNWMVGHDSVGWTKYLALDNSNLPITSDARWNDTAPSSTVVTLGDDTGINANTATYVAYCFAEIDGFSKAGSYVANASTDGPFVYCGFRPAFVIFMPIAGSGAGKWMLDTVRSPFNVADDIVQANTNAAEDSGSSYNLDFVSNGFKVRTSSDFNSSGRTIAFFAFAESPFKTANAR